MESDANTTYIPSGITDGYEAKAYIAERRGLHPAVRLKFRPMIWEEREALAGHLGTKSEADFAKIASDRIAKRIKSWDLTADSDKPEERKPLEITAFNVRTRQPELFWRLYLIVTGRDGGDVDPQTGPKEYNESADIASLAASEGRSIQDIAQEYNEKNS